MYQTYIFLRSLHDTEKFANELVGVLTRPAVIALTGDLGSGKTTLSQYIAKALGVREFLPSPTFTLMNEYSLPDSQVLIHSDLYRLKDATEVRELGIEDYFVDARAVTVVEWADRAESIFPSHTIWIHIDTKSEERIAVVRGGTQAFWTHFQEKGI
ncbi:MAG TPA: tRNA (adenosine(37)-N6)-threonylcarbamoyltransferase complex ATPase subunit type 1 TsaE [Patescibacteria group bacterium]